ncbi:CDP-alcohol phosphatidyltransferase [Spirochaeta thermophila DSM 6578]|uniref:CDP-alcohol phosphatidyltransferase n=1 Tax=Winmispira thermophila (strain ATCC 700085 / DSM 6578 / Z-1203) TaxID=869211 RepID=G0GBA4_WINT7|nr:CDP-alcohol phosphatidyltransferase family protein [Spirochaeta thermophila]AEJ61913.1 CDP-alcohol phosphatidyltransferase [Spirochaeta thermophila DSM 6578]
MKKETYIPIAHICGTVLFLGLIQWLGMLLVLWLYDIGFDDRILLYYILSVLFHLMLAGFLIIQRKDFYNLSHRRFLLRINIPNYLSLFRISSMPTLAILLVITWDYPSLAVLVVVFTALVFLSDLLDGFIARRTGEITKIGTYLDSMSDYTVLMVISIVFYTYRLIPMWFLWVVLIRLFTQGLGMGIILLIKGKVKVETSLLSKTSIFAIMVVYGLHILNLFISSRLLSRTILPAVDVAASVILAASLAEKLVKLWQYAHEEEPVLPQE